ncbi:OmpA family protein [Desulfobulbus sp.]|uniref:OmpA family protein n=1 Tax=Desulfobulbus sp. TaxID=895 RepID=UPI0027B8D538|nr:OmpA family protein [Desulfobulbus sp.]
MKTRPFLSFFLAFLLATAAACPARSQQPAPQADNALLASSGGRYIRMAHNFFIFYDPTTTMAVPYKNTGLTRIEAQKKILRESNASLPPLNWQAGLYPHWKGELWLPASPFAFKPYYRLQNYQKAEYGAAIEQLPTTPQSPPMLQTGLMKLEHLLGLPGRTELFLFSDGKHMTEEGLEPQPLDEARQLAAKYDICFNIVSSAVDAKARKLLKDIAAVNSCSQVMDFDTIYDHPEHLLGKLYADTQGNGFNNILFDFDKSAIRPEFTAHLDRLGQMLQANPQLYVVLSGFCDSIGTEAYNIGLSQRRAESVRRYLRKHFMIKEDRLLMYWYGYANPEASNATEEGRQLNRRVTIVLRGE